MLEPAKTVIEICGGYSTVAEMVGRSEVRVRRWAYPKERGGTGGVIPADCQQRLLDAARRAGKDLRPEHFFLAGVGSEGCDMNPSEDAA